MKDALTVIWDVVQRVVSWLAPLVRISRLGRTARRKTEDAEALARTGDDQSWTWWCVDEAVAVVRAPKGHTEEVRDKQGNLLTYRNIDSVRRGVFSGTDITPEVDIDAGSGAGSLVDTRSMKPWPPTRGSPSPHRLVRSTWFKLAVTAATWYSGQARLSELDEWEQICRAVHRGTDLGMGRERGWAHNELAAIARLRGNLHEAQEQLEFAQEQRRHRGRGQVLTNQMLVRLSQATESGSLPSRRGFLTAGEPLAHRLRARKDTVGRALTDLAQGARAILQAETAVTADLEDQAGADDMDPSRLSISLSARKAATRHLRDEAQEPFDQAATSLHGEDQLRAEAAARANLVLLYCSLGLLETDPVALDECLGMAERTAEAALDQNHEPLRDSLHRYDRVGEAALLLNLGAGLVWSDLDRIQDGQQRLDQSMDLWEALQKEASELKKPSPARYLLRGQGRCKLYLGDAAWRLADAADRVAERDTLFSEACSRWNEAHSLCRAARDIVGEQAALRRPGQRKPQEQGERQAEGESQEQGDDEAAV